MATAPVKVGILSIGDMGVGIARLLVANGFSVLTNCKGRSQDTVDRAKAAQVTLVETDGELADQCDIIFSVVPPRDAIETAQRIIDALPQRQRGDNDAAPLYFADMNAVSPSTCRRIASMFESSGLPVRLIDGSIIGGPPSLRDAGSGSGSGTWYRPHLPTSGPHELKAVSAELASALGARHISDAIGAASGLKMCFASMSKGYSAIATQAYTTAYRLGVLEDLRWALGDNAGRPERSITLMPPKAYRWVREMEEISDTFAEEGGFEPDLFRGCAGVFRAVADDTVLGQEKIGQRKRGTTADDAAAAIAEGLEAKKKKTE